MSHAHSPLSLCGPEHITRRTLFRATAGLGAAAWFSPVARLLAAEEEAAPRGEPAKSVILLWMQGAPSQLETFDPHAGKLIGGETKSIPTSVSGVEFGSAMEQTAELMDSLALIRNVVSREGDHERATYHVKTGYRPDPTLTHPSVGAILCHELDEEGVDIPRHISIYPGQWPGRGGYLGARFDAFRTNDPRNPIPDLKSPVAPERFDERLADLDVVERAFARGRLRNLDAEKTLHRATVDKAIRMMSSEQLAAFDISQEPENVRAAFGEDPFGRGALAAVRLVSAGVRCVEVSLFGWDTHVNNHEQQHQRAGVLDPALASVIRELKARDLFDSTLVICCGEFGRTPSINPAGGRDHWPHGFSVLLGGGGIRGGTVIGETDPEGGRVPFEEGTQVANVHATVLRAVGIDHRKEVMTPIGRPMHLTEGKVIPELLKG